MRKAIQASTPSKFIKVVDAFATEQEANVTIGNVISKDGYLCGYAETSDPNYYSLLVGNTMRKLVSHLDTWEAGQNENGNVLAKAPQIIEHAGVFIAVCNAIPCNV